MNIWIMNEKVPLERIEFWILNNKFELEIVSERNHNPQMMFSRNIPHSVFTMYNCVIVVSAWRQQ